MQVYASRTTGNQFTAEDILSVRFDSDGAELHEVFYTIEHISGPTVNHGGGAAAGEILQYKTEVNEETDWNEPVLMRVAQEAEGTSVIKVVAHVKTKADFDDYTTAVAAYLNDPVDTENSKVSCDSAPDIPEFTLYKTGEITLDYGVDSEV